MLLHPIPAYSSSSVIDTVFLQELFLPGHLSSHFTASCPGPVHTVSCLLMMSAPPWLELHWCTAKCLTQTLNTAKARGCEVAWFDGRPFCILPGREGPGAEFPTHASKAPWVGGGGRLALSDKHHIVC